MIAPPNVWIFGVFLDGKLASSIRLHIASPGCGELPALNVFSDILGPQLAAGRTIIDPTRFVADRELSRRYPELCYVTTRLAWLASEYFETDLLLATVRARTPGLLPAHLRAPGDLSAAALSIADKADLPDGARIMPPPGPAVPRRYPFFHSTYFERRMLFGREAALALGTAA